MQSISHRFYYSFLILVSICIHTGCDQQSRTAKKNSSPPSAIIQPGPGSLSPLEKERIRSACQAWYDSVLAPREFNGGILVAKQGHIVFEKYAGTAHIPGNDTINENTSLHIASVSKTFTAMGVLKMWQDGKLDIDEEYSRYFPAFNYPGVTIRTLLNHRSGLPNYTYFMEKSGWDKHQFVSNEDVLNYLITRKAELADIRIPNTHFSYCNTNYALLALLIEKISGKTYADFISQTFFIPLRMTNSFVFSLADTTRVIPSYNWRGKMEPINFLDRVYGDKNIYTTVRDLLTWDRALYNNHFFNSAILEQAYAGYSYEKPGIRNYGLGWRLYNYPSGKKIIYHNGWWHGSNASFIRLVYDSASIIVIGNKFTRAIYHAKALASVFGNYFGNLDEEEAEQLLNENNTSDTAFKPSPAGSKGINKKLLQKK